MITKIKLHGKLGKIYGKSFEFQNINKPMDVIKAMDSIIPGFKNMSSMRLKLAAITKL